MVLKIDLKVVMFIIAILLCGMLGSELSVTAQSAGEAESILSLPQAELSETRAPVPGGPGYVMVSSFSMTPKSYTTAYEFQGSTLYGSNDYFNFPVNVPHGATITKLVVYFLDLDASRNMLVNFYRDNNDNFTRTLIGQAASFGSAGLIYATDTSIDFPIVDLNNNNYSLELHFPDTPFGSYEMGFLSARVDYSYPAYLPTINN